jgi:hypothetical protein
MAIDYQNVLPDPNYEIGSDGGDGTSGNAAGSTGPGFASVSLKSTSPIMRTRTNSGRMVARAIKSHLWNIDISYNPMTRTEFEPVYNFLINRRGSLKPFFVSLPQYRNPQDSNLAGTIKVDGAAIAGATSMKIDGITAGNPTPGDLFTVTDLSDSNHKKTYRVTQVETNTHYNSVQPASDERIIHFMPGLQKATFNNADLVFTNPLIRVIATDVQEYALGNDGLYTFSLKLEEALP